MAVAHNGIHLIVDGGIWARAYDRLRPFGEDATMFDRPPAIADNALRRTSAWANTFLGRDHVTRRSPTSPVEEGSKVI